ncbi:hypothetical protein IP68_17055 [Blastomonas sp. AAP25]|nr:hypothetical protein IP68_17055 [Blastomonas sp. AAP25]
MAAVPLCRHAVRSGTPVVAGQRRGTCGVRRAVQRGPARARGAARCAEPHRGRARRRARDPAGHAARSHRTGQARSAH